MVHNSNRRTSCTAILIDRPTKACANYKSDQSAKGVGDARPPPPPSPRFPHSAFPHSQHVSATVSQFARKPSAASPPVQNPSQPTSPPSAPSKVDQKIADMTPEQILEAQREIASVLFPSSRSGQAPHHPLPQFPLLTPHPPHCPQTSTSSSRSVSG